MGLKQEVEASFGNQSDRRLPHPATAGLSWFETRIPFLHLPTFSRELALRTGTVILSVTGLAGMTPPAIAFGQAIPQQTTAQLEGEKPVEVAGAVAPAPEPGGETTNPEPAGAKTENGYAWTDGKYVSIQAPYFAAVDFDRIIERTNIIKDSDGKDIILTLKDVQTGQPRPGQAQHTETRTFLDIAQADGLEVVEDPTLPEKSANYDSSVSITTINGELDPWKNPGAAFMYSQIILKPERRNVIQIRVYRNPTCSADANTPESQATLEDASQTFYSGRAFDLAEAAFMYKDADPDTKFESPGVAANTPQSYLAVNLIASLPFQIAT